MEAVAGSITAFQIFAPGLVNPNAIRWGSLVVFGGAGIAALVGLVMVFTHCKAQGPDASSAGEPTAES